MNRIVMLFGAAALGFGIPAASARIVVKSTDNNDCIPVIRLDIKIDSTGIASTDSLDFSVSGSTLEKGAFNRSIGLAVRAVKNISAEASTRGSELNDGTVDRDNSGRIGVFGNPGSGGIGQDSGSREGLIFIFDQLKGVKSSVKVQITKINVQFVGRDESFSVVNLATREVGYFSGADIHNGDGDVDVSGLNLWLQGGMPGPAAALYCGDMPTVSNNFRVRGVTLEFSSRR